MSLRILIVDDDHATRFALTEVLRDEGHFVDSCSAAHDALARLQEAAYDVLLSDFIMPGMDGVELAHAARKLHDSLRCILISGHPPSERAAAFVSWQRKPLDVEALLLILKG